MKINNQKHGFHLVDVSPWPIISAFSALMLTFGGVLFMHGYSSGFYLLRFGLEMILFMMFVWWNDVIREGTIEGQHTFVVQRGLRLVLCCILRAGIFKKIDMYSIDIIIQASHLF